jgi:tetratricopeptide (TPR) repeat protein
MAPAAPLHEPSLKEAVSQFLSQGWEEEKRGNNALAFDYYLRAFRKDPTSQRASEALRRISLLLHKKSEASRQEERRDYVDRAQRSWEKKDTKFRETSSRLEEGKRHFKQDRALEAAHVFHRLLEESPDFDPAKHQLQKVQDRLAWQLRKGRFSSLQHYYAALGVFFYTLGDWQKAAEALGSALDQGTLPDDLMQAHVAEYAASARLKWDSQSWEKEKAELLQEAVTNHNIGRMEESQVLLKKVLTREPGNARARELMELVEGRLAEKRQSEESKARQAALYAGMTRGLDFMRNGLYVEALEEFARALEADPANAEAKAYLRQSQEALRKRGEYAPTVSIEDKAEMKYKEGLRLYGNGDVEGARNAFQEAVRLNAQHEDAQFALELLKQKEAMGQ